MDRMNPSMEYQGYTNPETWAVANYLANEARECAIIEGDAARHTTVEAFGAWLRAFYVGMPSVGRQYMARFRAFAPWAFLGAPVSLDGICTSIDWDDVARRWEDFLA